MGEPARRGESGESGFEEHAVDVDPGGWFDEPAAYDKDGLRVNAGRAGAQKTPKTGKRIERARKAKGLSRQRLSSMIGISKEGLRKIETGQNIPFTVTLLDLEDALGVPMSELLDKQELRAARRSTNDQRSESASARHEEEEQD